MWAILSLIFCPVNSSNYWADSTQKIYSPSSETQIGIRLPQKRFLEQHQFLVSRGHLWNVPSRMFLGTQTTFWLLLTNLFWNLLLWWTRSTQLCRWDEYRSSSRIDRYTCKNTSWPTFLCLSKIHHDFLISFLDVDALISKDFLGKSSIFIKGNRRAIRSDDLPFQANLIIVLTNAWGLMDYTSTIWVNHKIS